MGIDDQSNVEEPTEPPICGSTNASPSVNDPNNSSQPSSDWLSRAHTLSAVEVTRLLRTHIHHGLDTAEAAHRLEQNGPNKVEGAKGLSVWKIFMRQISNSLTVVLLIVMVLSFAIADYIEGGVILAVILLNIVVG